jgi:hypothetical protein
MAKYVVLNTVEILPLGIATSKKAANEIGEATGTEDYDIVEGPVDLSKHYKLPEIVRLHNSVVEADDAVLRFKSKAVGAEAAWKAMCAFDYEAGSPEVKEGKPKEAGRSRPRVIWSRLVLWPVAPMAGMAGLVFLRKACVVSCSHS